MSGWDHVESYSEEILTGEPLLRALDQHLRRTASGHRYVDRSGDAALLAPLTGLVEMAGGQADEGMALFVTARCSDESLRGLLVSLQNATIEGSEPRWGLVTQPDPLAVGAGLAAFRGAGPVLQVGKRTWGPDSPACEIIPLSLSALAFDRSELASGPKRPEGPEDNLDRRGDWFKRRSGEEP